MSNTKEFKSAFVIKEQILKVISQDKIDHIVHVAGQFGRPYPADLSKLTQKPIYPDLCANFFKNRRSVKYDFATPAIMRLDAWKIDSSCIQDVYEGSHTLLKYEYGSIKIYDLELQNRLVHGESVYVFMLHGHLFGCTTEEAAAFTDYYCKVLEYQEQLKTFDQFEREVEKLLKDEQITAQSNMISSKLNLAWHPAYCVQWRLLHSEQEIVKRNTVIHIRMEESLKKGRLQRDSGELLCGGRSKFGYSDHWESDNQHNKFVTCPKCLKYIEKF